MKRTVSFVEFDGDEPKPVPSRSASCDNAAATSQPIETSNLSEGVENKVVDMDSTGASAAVGVNDIQGAIEAAKMAASAADPSFVSAASDTYIEADGDASGDEWDQHLILAGEEEGEEASPLAATKREKSEDTAVSTENKKLKKSVSFSQSFIVVQLEYISPEYVPTPPNGRSSGAHSPDEHDEESSPKRDKTIVSIADKMAELEAQAMRTLNDDDDDHFLLDNEGPKAFSIMDVFSKLQGLEASTTDGDGNGLATVDGSATTESAPLPNDEKTFMANELLSALTKMATGSDLYRIPAVLKVRALDDTCTPGSNSPPIEKRPGKEFGSSGASISQSRDEGGALQQASATSSNLWSTSGSHKRMKSSGVLRILSGEGTGTHSRDDHDVGYHSVASKAIENENVGGDVAPNDSSNATRFSDGAESEKSIAAAENVTDAADGTRHTVIHDAVLLAPAAEGTVTTCLPDTSNEDEGASEAPHAADRIDTAVEIKGTDAPEQGLTDGTETLVLDNVNGVAIDLVAGRDSKLTENKPINSGSGSQQQQPLQSIVEGKKPVADSEADAVIRIDESHHPSRSSSVDISAGVVASGGKTVMFSKVHSKFPLKLEPIPGIDYLAPDISLDSFNSDFICESSRRNADGHHPTADHTTNDTNSNTDSRPDGMHTHTNHHRHPHFRDAQAHSSRSASDNALRKRTFEQANIARRSFVDGTAADADPTSGGDGGVAITNTPLQPEMKASPTGTSARAEVMFKVTTTAGADIDVDAPVAAPKKKKKKGVSMRDFPIDGDASAAAAADSGGKTTTGKAMFIESFKPETAVIKEEWSPANDDDARVKETIAPAPKSPAAGLKEKTKPTNRQPPTLTLTSKGDFIRFQRICRRAEVAIDISTGLESYKAKETMGHTFFLWFVVPTMACILTFGILPYGLFGMRGAWAVSLIPWAAIMGVSAVLSLELYSMIISEIEFRVVLSEQSTKIYIVTAVVAAAASIVTQCIIFGAWKPAQGRSWLLMLAAGGIAILVALLREFHLSAKMLSTEDRAASTRPFRHFLAGLFTMLPTACICYVVYITGFSELNKMGNHGKSVAFAMACCFPLLRFALTNFVKECPLTRWGGGMGQLCAGELVPLLASTWHAAFLSLVVGCVATPWQTVALGAVEVFVQIAALARIAYLPQVPHTPTEAASDDDNNNAATSMNQRLLDDGGWTGVFKHLRSLFGCSPDLFLYRRSFSGSAKVVADHAASTAGGGVGVGAGDNSAAVDVFNDIQNTSKDGAMSPSGDPEKDVAGTGCGGRPDARISSTLSVFDSADVDPRPSISNHPVGLKRSTSLESDQAAAMDPGDHMYARDIEAGLQINSAPVTVTVNGKMRKDTSKSPPKSPLKAAARIRTFEDDRVELDTAMEITISSVSGIFLPLAFLACCAVLSVGPNRGIFGGYVDSKYTWYHQRLWSVSIFSRNGDEAAMVGTANNKFDGSKGYFWAPSKSSASELVWKLLGISALHLVLLITGSYWLRQRGNLFHCSLGSSPQGWCFKADRRPSKYADGGAVADGGATTSEQKAVSHDVLGLISALFDHSYAIVGMSVTLSLLIVFSVIFPWYGMNSAF